MITATFADDGEKLSLIVDGHAGAAPHGQDLICSAVTAFVYTAAVIADEMAHSGLTERTPIIHMESGRASIFLHPRSGCLREARMKMGVIQTGIELLADNYPGNVRVNIIGYGNKPIK